MHSKLNMQKVAVTPHVRLSRLQELQLAKNINAFTRAKRVVCVCVCVCVFCLSVCVIWGGCAMLDAERVSLMDSLGWPGERACKCIAVQL